MHSELCICELAPKLSLTTRLFLIIHKRELKRPSNSGRWAMLCLPNSEMRVRGEMDQPLNTLGLVDDQHTTLMLYPSAKSILITREFVDSLKKPISLIVPDGNWGQASRTSARIAKEFPEIVHVTLPAGMGTNYRLRKEMQVDGMSTFEAIARTLSVIEGEKVGDELEHFFGTAIERMLKMRGVHD